MVALTRSSLLWVPHAWISGTNPLQTPRTWFWGTHKWAISAALLGGGVSRTVGNVLVFGPPLHRGIERRSLRQSSWVWHVWNWPCQTRCCSDWSVACSLCVEPWSGIGYMSNIPTTVCQWRGQGEFPIVVCVWVWPQNTKTCISCAFSRCACWPTDCHESSHNRNDCLIGLVVKASALGAEDPRFQSRWLWDFSRLNHYQWLKKWHSSGYPARCQAL